MEVFQDLKGVDQSLVLRESLKKHKFYRALLESEKDTGNIKDKGKQQYIENLQTHLDIINIVIQDLEILERYVIEQIHYEGIKQKILAERLNMDVKDIIKIKQKALKKIKINLCKMDIGVTNRDNLKKGMF